MVALSPLLGLNASPLHADPVTMAIIVAFAKGAGGYAAGRLAEPFLGDAGPSNQDVIDAIHASTEEIKIHVSSAIRSAILEDNIRELQAEARTALGYISSYSMASEASKSNYEFYLIQADLASDRGMDAADSLGEAGITIYSIFGSIKLLSQATLFDLHGDRNIYVGFADNLLAWADTLEIRTSELLKSRSSGVRISSMDCRVIEEGDLLPRLQCTYDLDGVNVSAYNGFLQSGNVAPTKGRVERDYQSKVASLDAEWNNLMSEIGAPMREVASHWKDASHFIKDGSSSGVVQMSDMSGPHVFANDDNHQFIDVWYNENDNVTIKVSNGQRFQPMWIVAHINFLSNGQIVASKDYHVYCGAPDVGGGKERWFVFPGPGVAADSLQATTNKEAAWTTPGDGWEVHVGGSWPAP